MDCFGVFIGKFLLCPELVRWIVFGPEMITFKHFFKSVHYMFLQMCLMKGIKSWVKVTALYY